MEVNKYDVKSVLLNIYNPIASSQQGEWAWKKVTREHFSTKSFHAAFAAFLPLLNR